MRPFDAWALWARQDQAPPPGDWIVWLILAGRGAGKTRAGAEAVRQWSKSFPLVNLIGPTADDVRDVMVLGESGPIRRIGDLLKRTAGDRARILAVMTPAASAAASVIRGCRPFVVRRTSAKPRR